MDGNVAQSCIGTDKAHQRCELPMKAVVDIIGAPPTGDLGLEQPPVNC